MGFLLPKPRPRLLDKRDARAAVADIDRRERAKVRARSGGQCEMRMRGTFGVYRCPRHASENHHLIGGIGRRNKGRSILAEHRLHLCAACHTDITGNVLVPDVDRPGAECAATVRYARVR